MDVMDELRSLIETADSSLPYRPNRVRQNLDFSVVPEIVYNDGLTFIKNCMEWKETFICDLFNHYYEKMNSIVYCDDPKMFQVNDFAVYHREISSNNHIIVVTLPDDFMGSSDFCRAYVIAYRQQTEKPDNIQFFAIADSSYGWLRIYRITERGEQIFLNRAAGKLSEDIEGIIKTAFT